MKNNKMVRLLSLVLCLCLMLSLFAAVAPVEAEAVSTRNGSEQTITINMFDVYGDGWGNNAIRILENGETIDEATFPQGKEGTWTYTMKPDCEYAFVWVKGAWSSECYFDIYIGGELVFSATTTDCNLFADGKVLYPLCEHPNYDVVVTPATCKKDGFSTYTCTTCGFSFVSDEKPATGHYFGDDDFCDYCGFDINSIRVVISMTDSFGDGWNGNCILLYENGELIETITLQAGMRNDTWTYDLDVNKEYDFFWKKGNFPNECSFTISFDDEIVYTATQNMCSGFKDNHLLYPPCTHVECDAVITPETCTTYGYTTYTCKKCGNTTIGNIVLSTGHSYGNDSICDTCGFDKDGITINMNDSYGDGWGSNAIEIYADGVLVGTATLASGTSGKYFLAVDKEKEYTFRWVKGYSTYECSFEIILAGESVYYASGSDCDKFIGGQQFYPYVEYSGWTELGGKVYYFDPVTHMPVTGVNRLPYPTKPINGITYAPNPDDVAYFESKGLSFIDKDEAWFFFDSYTAEFKSNTTGIWSVQVVDTYGYRYVVNGMIPWHVGLVQEMGYYWYFTGDEIYGGNTVVYGDVHASRNNTDFDMVVGGIYTFDWMGHMCQYDGIVDVDGVLRYYENNRLMVGNGLTKVGDNYVYVRSTGELAIGTYYVTNIAAELSDLYRVGQKVIFDENGFAEPTKHGIVEENGALYYYQYGSVQYNAGLIEVDGAWIYVRSNGILATGKYWITNTNGNMDAGYYNFDENGYMIVSDIEDGIVAEGENLYYYLNGEKQYALGLVKLEDGTYIYVRTGGELAVGSYWITNHNGWMDEGMYVFGEDGILSMK